VAGNVPLRALLVTQLLGDSGASHATDLENFLENLSRDLHHERELRLWEAIAGSYAVACQSYDLDTTQRRALYSFLLMASMGKADEPAMEILTAQVVGPVWEHFQALLQMVHGEVVSGEGGLRGVILATEEAPASDSEERDDVI
jgi:hypothetical protein